MHTIEMFIIGYNSQPLQGIQEPEMKCWHVSQFVNHSIVISIIYSMNYSETNFTLNLKDGLMKPIRLQFYKIRK